jgi:hypothetical protein
MRSIARGKGCHASDENDPLRVYLRSCRIFCGEYSADRFLVNRFKDGSHARDRSDAEQIVDLPEVCGSRSKRRSRNSLRSSSGSSDFCSWLSPAPGGELAWRFSIDGAKLASGAILLHSRLDFDFGQLVVVERDSLFQLTMLIVRIFIGPDGVLELLAVDVQIEISRRALERTFCRRR